MWWMCKELLARGMRVGKERVRKPMKRYRIQARGKRQEAKGKRQKAKGKRKFVVTTDSKHKLPIAHHLFNPQVVGRSMHNNMHTNAVNARVEFSCKPR